MKKYIIVLFVFITVSVQSQIEPDTFYGRLNMNSISSQDNFIQQSVSVGVFFTDKFLLGVLIPIRYDVHGEAETFFENVYVKPEKRWFKNFSMSLLSKYYIDLPASEKFKFFIEAEAGLGRYITQKSEVYSYKFGGGVSWFVNQKMSIDFNLMYGYLSVESKSTDFFFDDAEIYEGLEPGIGVSFYL